MREMDRKGVIICGVVGFLGLLSAATGFAAEATKIKVRARVLKEKYVMDWGFGIFIVWSS